MMKRYSIPIFYGLLLVFGLAQFPFLNADPDASISDSRGPHTDEGLYTAQAANFIHTGHFEMDNNDACVKTPLLTGVMVPTFYLFGVKKAYARGMVLFLTLLIIGYFFSKNKRNIGWGTAFVVLGLFQYYLFHFAHFSLSEILSSCLILGAVICLSDILDRERFSWKDPVLPSLLLGLSFLFKIQFLYTLPLFIVFFIIKIIYSKNRLDNVKLIASSMIAMMVFVGLFYCLWVMPNQEVFDHVLGTQSSSRYPEFSNLFTQIEWAYDYMLNNQFLWPFTQTVIFFFPVGIFLAFKRQDNWYIHRFILLSLWMLFEFHKLGMTYLPTRYLIGLICVQTAWIALVLFQFYHFAARQKNNLKWLAILPILWLFLLGGKNIYDYKKSYDSRTFVMQEIETYLSSNSLNGKPILGAWAPSLSWSHPSPGYPVWQGYFNDNNTLVKFDPAIVVSELNEEDSGGAYRAQGIDLDSEADSIIYFDVNRWKLKLVWISPRDEVK